MLLSSVQYFVNRQAKILNLFKLSLVIWNITESLYTSCVYSIRLVETENFRKNQRFHKKFVSSYFENLNNYLIFESSKLPLSLWVSSHLLKTKIQNSVGLAGKFSCRYTPPPPSIGIVTTLLLLCTFLICSTGTQVCGGGAHTRP